MKTLTIKERLELNRRTYKPGVYTIVEADPTGWQVTPDEAKQLQEQFPDAVKVAGGRK